MPVGEDRIMPLGDHLLNSILAEMSEAEPELLLHERKLMIYIEADARSGSCNSNQNVPERLGCTKTHVSFS